MINPWSGWTQPGCPKRQTLTGAGGIGRRDEGEVTGVENGYNLRLCHRDQLQQKASPSSPIQTPAGRILRHGCHANGEGLGSYPITERASRPKIRSRAADNGIIALRYAGGRPWRGAPDCESKTHNGPDRRAGGIQDFKGKVRDCIAICVSNCAPRTGRRSQGNRPAMNRECALGRLVVDGHHVPYE